MADRYREMSPSPGHFLANSTPLSSNDTYTTYLSSTVHTPVKRYIPTPPLTCTNDQTSQYSDGPTMSNPGYHLSLPPQNALTQIGSSQTLKPSKSRMNQQQQAPQYRINMKCCSDSQKQQQQQQQINTSTLPLPSSTHTDHYATTPRIRPASVNTKGSGSGVSNSSTATSICCAQSQTGNQCEYGTRPPSADYASISSSSRVATPINLMSQADQSCLNCRRTTGVHQTTQTTGPIRLESLKHCFAIQLPTLFFLSSSFQSCSATADVDANDSRRPSIAIAAESTTVVNSLGRLNSICCFFGARANLLLNSFATGED